MIALPHRIRRLRWQVRTASQEDALTVRMRVRDQWLPAALSALAAWFDAVGGGEDTIQVSRLELCVRLTGPDQTPEWLLPRIETQVREQLLGATSRTAATPERWRRKPASEARLDALIEFLKTGSLPWEYAQFDLHDVVTELRAAADSIGDWLLDSIAFAPLVRLLALLPERDWASLLPHLLDLAPGSRQRLSDALGALATGLEGQELTRYARVRLAAAAIARAAAPSDPHIAREAQTLAEAYLANLPGATASLLMSWLESVGTVPGGEAAHHPAAEETRSTRSTCVAMGLSVPYAGLVLLHPFLPALFEATGVARRGERFLRSPERAAALLYLLATGEEEAQEFELGFIKVLVCQRPESLALVTSGLLSSTDRTETQSLLEAVIGHWSVLRRTSVAGLRQSFLQRRGLLFEQDNAWRLQVEPHAFDVLIDYLPWGVGVVALPWVTKPIVTEWRA